MSNFINDTSIQQSYIPTISFSYNTLTNPDINFNGTSGIYNSTSYFKGPSPLKGTQL